MEFQTKYQGPWVDVDADDLLTHKVGEWRYQRPIIEVEKCSRCGLCYLYCPTGCIEDDGTCFAIDLEYCKGCGICVKACPINVISMVREETG